MKFTNNKEYVKSSVEIVKKKKKKEKRSIILTFILLY